MQKNLLVLTRLVMPINLRLKKFLFSLTGVFLIIITLNTNAQIPLSIPCNSSTLTNSYGYYGGFEAGGTNGNNNFLPGAASTDYSYGSGQTQYQILQNTIGQSGYLPLLPHSGGYFLTSHTSSSRPDLKLWYKTLIVSPGQIFQVCAWVADLKLFPVGGFPVNIVVNTSIGSTVIATQNISINDWVQFCGTYIVPSGVTSLDFEIKDPTPSFNGSSHFLGLDDICITDITPSTNPDFNSTFINVAVTGNTATNDKVPAGTTYGTSPTLVSSPSGSVGTLTMNSDGTYSFTANTAGVYTYDVQVCVPGQTAPCPVSRLVITVLNATIITNAPVANVDIATTNFNTAVTLQTLANDAAGNPNNSLVPSSVVVTLAPKNGTTSINTVTGNITYTPTAGFTGMDTLTYQVCDNQVPAKCATALEIITVKPSGSTLNTTTAVDDYKITTINTPATGNVKTNDSDAEGNTQTVTAQTTTVAGKGTLVLNSDGSYTFTPVTGFTGPVDFPYTTCDNGTPQACATATLHILVEPAASPDLTPRINLTPNNIIGPSVMEITVQVNELNNVRTNGSLITLFVDKQNLFSNFTFNTTLTTNIAGQPIQNSLFNIDAVSNPDFYVITTNALFANSLLRLSFSVLVNPGQTKGTTPLNVYLQNASGGETNFTNNSSFTVLTFSFPIL